MEHTIDPAPNAGIGAAMLSGDCKRACLVFAQRAAQLYRARVHKHTHELELATSASTEILNTRFGPRYMGVVTVDSPHFLPHEEGWTDDETGEHFDGAHDFNAVLADMAGLPIPAIPQTPGASTANRRVRAESRQRFVDKRTGRGTP